jgi:two-component system nitrogen regulation response regulator GlnG
MNPDKANILIVDDEPGVCWAMAELARSMGHAAETASDAAAGMEKLSAGGFDVVVLDIQLPGLNGLEALPKIRASHPDVPVVVITAYGTMQTAVDAVQRGAFEYLLKPVDMDTLRTVLSGAVECRRRQAELTAATPEPMPEQPMTGRCGRMQEVFKQIALVAGTDMTVLIQGETGTGKELAARAIHRFSPRAAGPFVAVNCSLLSGEIVGSELFGHDKGAFTSADRPAPGKVEVADGGTLLLDEVGDLAPDAQGRLLRFLDDGEFFRVGSVQARRADVRVIAATNRLLRAAALAGQFRRDLFFRISAVTIDLPPLRDRGDDVELLIDRFLAEGAAAGMTAEARATLKAYSFPGNVRELRNAIEHAAAMAGEQPIAPEHLPEAVSRPVVPAQGATLEQWADAMLDQVLASGTAAGYEELMRRWDEPLLAAGMKRFAGNQARLAAALHLHRSTLRKKLRAYGLIDGGPAPQSGRDK